MSIGITVDNEEGDSVPRRKIPLSIYVNPKTFEAIKKEADKFDISVPMAITQLVEQRFGEPAPDWIEAKNA